RVDLHHHKRSLLPGPCRGRAQRCPPLGDRSPEAEDILASLAEVNLIETVNNETTPGLFHMWKLVRLFVRERTAEEGFALGARMAEPRQCGTCALPHPVHAVVTKG
ncbi:hypothetical protein ABZ772_37575, partial [Streptomyces griseoincarnatus]